MTRSIPFRRIVGVAAVTLAIGAIANTAAASADNSGSTYCPPAFQLVSVAYLESVGPYVEPAIVDQAGNDDGYVCAQQWSAGREKADCQSGGTVACELIELGLPGYHYTDDDVPSPKPPGSGA